MSTQLPAGSVAAARRVTGSCRDFNLDKVKFRVVCRGNLEIGLESYTQVGLLAIEIYNGLYIQGGPKFAIPRKNYCFQVSIFIS